jgi:hypothetical protein
MLLFDPIHGLDQGDIESLDDSSFRAGGGGIEIDKAAIGILLIGTAEQFVIDAIPVAVVLINALTTNFEFNLFEEVLTGIERSISRLLEGELKEHSADEISISGDGADSTFPFRNIFKV